MHAQHPAKKELSFGDEVKIGDLKKPTKDSIDLWETFHIEKDAKVEILDMQDNPLANEESLSKFKEVKVEVLPPNREELPPTEFEILIDAQQSVKCRMNRYSSILELKSQISHDPRIKMPYILLDQNHIELQDKKLLNKLPCFSLILATQRHITILEEDVKEKNTTLKTIPFDIINISTIGDLKKFLSKGAYLAFDENGHELFDGHQLVNKGIYYLQNPEDLKEKTFNYRILIGEQNEEMKDIKITKKNYKETCNTIYRDTDQ